MVKIKLHKSIVLGEVKHTGSGGPLRGQIAGAGIGQHKFRSGQGGIAHGLDLIRLERGGKKTKSEKIIHPYMPAQGAGQTAGLQVRWRKSRCAQQGS